MTEGDFPNRPSPAQPQFSLSSYAITEIVRCRTSLVQGAERCFVVNGQLTLVGDSNIRWAVPVTLDLVRLTMDDGMLNDIHQDVIDVQYLNAGIPEYDFGGDNSGDGSSSDGDGYGGPSTIKSDDGAIQAWPWVVLGCGVFLLVAGLYLIRKRLQRNRNKDTDGYEAASRSSPAPVLPGIEGSFSDSYLQDEEAERYRSPPNGSNRLNQTVASPRSPKLHLFENSDDDDYEMKTRHFI